MLTNLSEVATQSHRPPLVCEGFSFPTPSPMLAAYLSKFNLIRYHSLAMLVSVVYLTVVSLLSDDVECCFVYLLTVDIFLR
jgi:hypothetical protein